MPDKQFHRVLTNLRSNSELDYELTNERRDKGSLVTVKNSTKLKISVRNLHDNPLQFFSKISKIFIKGSHCLNCQIVKLQVNDLDFGFKFELLE